MSLNFRTLARLEAAGAHFVLVTVIDTGGSTPRLAGSIMAVLESSFHGTIGGGAFEQIVLEKARSLLSGGGQSARFATHLTRDLGMCCGGRMEVFMQRIEPKPTLWIYGAGHVGTALALTANGAGFAVQVVDERAEWADAGRFPEAVSVHDADPEDFARATPPGSQDFVVVVTHSHPLDEALTRSFLLQPGPPKYLGLIGSKGKWARFAKRLEARGVPVDRLAAVRCPVGLNIGAQTPEEIAISVVAELIQRRRAC